MERERTRLHHKWATGRATVAEIERCMLLDRQHARRTPRQCPTCGAFLARVGPIQTRWKCTKCEAEGPVS